MLFDPGVFDPGVFDVGEQPAEGSGSGGRAPFNRNRHWLPPQIEPSFQWKRPDPVLPEPEEIPAVVGRGRVRLRVLDGWGYGVITPPAVFARGRVRIDALRAGAYARMRQSARAHVDVMTLQTAGRGRLRQAVRAGWKLASVRPAAKGRLIQRVKGGGRMKLSARGDGFEDGLLLQHIREMEDHYLLTGQPDDNAARLLMLEDSGWRDIHRAADRFVKDLENAVLDAFDAGMEAMSRDALKAALVSQDMRQVYLLVSGAIMVTANTLRPELEAVYTDIMRASGRAAARRLRKQIAPRDARLADVAFAFDVTDPRAVEWISNHAAETITGISEKTRTEIRDLVEEAFVEQFDVDELADKIAEVIDDPDRADTIARTESMRASNQGQIESWKQATDEGLLTGEEQKEWITTPDDRLCPICEPLDGETTPMDKPFSTELGRVDGPPVHPNCRCTIGLSVPTE